MSSWVKDVDGFGFNAQVIEQSHKLPVLVDFWAAWCGPCRTLTPLLIRVVNDLAGKVILAKVDVDREPALASRYGIRSLPTVKLFRDGAPAAEFIGALPEGEVKRFLAPYLGALEPDVLVEARALAAAGDLVAAAEALTTALHASPENYRLVGPLADLEVRLGRLDAARARLQALPLAELNESVELAQARLRLHTEVAAGAATDASPAGLAYGVGIQACVAGDVDAGLAALLDSVASDKTWREGAARKALLDVFIVLGADEPRVRQARSRLSSLLM